MTTTLLMLGVTALLIFLLAAWLLARRGWLISFLIGLCGLTLLVTSAMLILMTFRLSAYDPLAEGMRIGTLTVISTETSDEYRITLLQDRNLNRYDLEGDTWRVSGRLLTTPTWALWGRPQDVFVVRAVQGRYQDMEQELATTRASAGLYWYESLADHLLARLFSARDLHSALLPMASEAIFHLEIHAGALRLVAVNEPAEEALAR